MIWDFSIAIHMQITIISQVFFGVLTNRSRKEASGPPSAKFPR